MSTTALLQEDEIPTAQALTLYVIGGHCACCGGLALIVFTIFVIWRYSGIHMRTYRLYLISELLWSFATEASLSIISPVALLPIPCAVSPTVGVADVVVGPMLIFFAMCLSGHLLALVAQFMYRFVHSLPPDSKLNRLNLEQISATKIIAGYAVAAVTGTVFISAPFATGMTDQATHRALLLATDPALGQILERFPSTFCASSGVTLPNMAVVGICFCMSCVVVAFIVAVVLMRVNIQQSFYARRTRRLQMMLFRSLAAQILVTVLFLVLPTLLLAAGTVFGARNLPKGAVLVVLAAVVYMYADCCMVLLLIKPYRRYVFTRCLRLQSNIALPQSSGDKSCRKTPVARAN